jgi:uncharacterized protein YjaZ
MLWIVGGAVVALMSVACGLNLGSRAASGKELVYQPAWAGWAVGFHGAAGVLALWLFMQVR